MTGTRVLTTEEGRDEPRPAPAQRESELQRACVAWLRAAKSRCVWVREAESHA